jgi:RimJ/RimL family protein N-acetyltransferase
MQAHHPYLQDWYIREVTEQDAYRLMCYFSLIASEPVNNTSVRRGSVPQTAEQQRTALQRYLNHPNYAMWVVETYDSDIVGVVQCEGNTSAFSQHVATLHINVHPEYRGLGIGKALIQQALDWARSNPEIHRLQLEVLARNTEAIRLYKRMGFVVEGFLRNAYHLVDEAGSEYVSALIMAQEPAFAEHEQTHIEDCLELQL